MADDLDARLSGALRELAEPSPTDGVLERVATRRLRRERHRRVRNAGVGVLAVVAIVVGGVAVWRGGDDESARVATSPESGDVRVARGMVTGDDLADAGRAVEMTPVAIDPDAGYVRSPLLASGSTVALASYERDGRGYTFPPSHVVRADPDGTVVDRIDLEGEILDLADGEGARWALTHDKVVEGPDDPEYRVKRLGPDGSVVSNAVPPGEVPAGDLVAAGGGVWLPVVDGVLRFDPLTGAYAAKTPLDVPTDRRGIADLGKFVGVTDGIWVRRLDPSTNTAPEAVATPAPTFGNLLDLAGDVDEVWTHGADARGRRWASVLVLGEAEAHVVDLPRDLANARLNFENGVAWVEGNQGGKTVALQLPERGEGDRVARTIVLLRGENVAITFLDRDRAVIVADGRMHVARLG